MNTNRKTIFKTSRLDFLFRPLCNSDLGNFLQLQLKFSLCMIPKFLFICFRGALSFICDVRSRLKEKKENYSEWFKSQTLLETRMTVLEIILFCYISTMSRKECYQVVSMKQHRKDHSAQQGILSHLANHWVHALGRSLK